MKKIEYKETRISIDNRIKELNQLGTQGWILISERVDADDDRYLEKGYYPTQMKVLLLREV